MVSSKNLIGLRKKFNEHRALELPDFFSLESDLRDVLFELYNLDSFIAGVVTRVLDENSSITQDEANILSNSFIDGNELTICSSGKISSNSDDFLRVVEYVKSLDELREAVVLSALRTLAF